MGRLRGAMSAAGQGYTIVEVSIVLAISGVLFISAASLLGNKKQGTDFEQVMQDLSSKIESVANQVKSGNYDDFSSYTCSINGQGRPTLTQPAGGGTPNQACTVLGRAMQVTAESDRIFIYTVLGLRTVSGTAPTSILAAMPEPVMGDGPTLNNTGVDLTEEYKLAGSAKIVYATAAVPTENNDMIGFYLAPVANVAVGQGSTFTSLAYLFQSNTNGSYKESPDSYTSTKACLEQLASNDCQNPTTLGKWELCVHSTDDSRQAVLEVRGISGGITTNIVDKDCKIE